MIDSFALRNLIEVTQRWAGITSRQRDGYAFIAPTDELQTTAASERELKDMS